MKLPVKENNGRYVLPCGSIIYPSGGDYHDPHTKTEVKMPDAGKWMMWVRTGTDTRNAHPVPTGEFVMDRAGPTYYRSPLEALQAFELDGKGLLKT